MRPLERLTYHVLGCKLPVQHVYLFYDFWDSCIPHCSPLLAWVYNRIIGSQLFFHQIPHILWELMMTCTDAFPDAWSSSKWGDTEWFFSLCTFEIYVATDFSLGETLFKSSLTKRSVLVTPAQRNYCRIEGWQILNHEITCILVFPSGILPLTKQMFHWNFLLQHVTREACQTCFWVRFGLNSDQSIWSFGQLYAHFFQREFQPGVYFRNSQTMHAGLFFWKLLNRQVF